jgi:peptide/nickel transport system substrate-binding protein
MVKALERAGLKATSDVNVRSASWCSDWPSGTTWLPTVCRRCTPRPTRTGPDHWAVDEQIEQIQLMPLSQQPGAWNDLDKQMMTTYFPLFPTYCGGVVMAHGSQIRGMNDDNALGMPTWNTMWVGQRRTDPARGRGPVSPVMPGPRPAGRPRRRIPRRA